MKTFLLHNVTIPGLLHGNYRVLFNSAEIINIERNEGSLPKADEVIDGQGAMLLPGAIDAHVHFREPGLIHKADIATESRAALAGGVTSFFDMPNTVPQTVTQEAWQEKCLLANEKSAINYAFFIGVTNDNIDRILQIDPSLIPGYKVFLGSSIGGMLVNNDAVLEKLFANARAPIVVHAEDENIIAQSRERIIRQYGENPPIHTHSSIRSADACIAATRHALSLARKYPQAHLHIAHVSTAAEVTLIQQAKAEGLRVTAEVSPHHLLFTNEDYPVLGARIKMNPSVKTALDREALRNAVRDGIIDIIATDHAPHTLAEKEGDALTAISGAPMVQFSLPLMLDMFDPETVRRVMCENPARIFGLKDRGLLAVGNAPEMVLVKPIPQGFAVTDNDVLSKCGWTPLVGRTLRHKVIKTILPRPTALTFHH